MDGDGYGDPSTQVATCTPPSGYVSLGEDCDDGNPSIHPGAPELCDGIDNNCDSLVDEGVGSEWFADADGDGYGDDLVSIFDCVAPSGYVAQGGDCDDTNPTIHPGATELCDGVDNDCNGIVDDVVWYADADGDGYGDDTVTSFACPQPSGYVAQGGDCDDGDFSIYPGAPELCDGLDHDCDGIPDSGVGLPLFYPDADGDGWGVESSPVAACSPPSGYVTQVGDCDDSDAGIYPGAPELADGLDNDCDGAIDEFTITGVTDVGNDQGRKVRVAFTAEENDAPATTYTITSYSLYRRVEPGLAPGVLGGAADPPGDWDFVKTIPATGNPSYQTTVETLCDSTDQGICWSTFFVRAHTPDPLVHFETAEAAGYSVDNLAPGIPQNLVFAGPTLLAWDEAPEADFDHHTVYGSSSPTLDGSEVLVGYTTGTGYDVGAAPYPYYLVTTSDESGNEGPAATILSTVGTPGGGAPLRTFLHAPRPNPFRAGTTLGFDLEEAADVRLAIYDVRGREVAMVAEGRHDAGRHTATWDGRDATGTLLPAGIYFATYRTAGYSATRKMILVR